MTFEEKAQSLSFKTSSVHELEAIKQLFPKLVAQPAQIPGKFNLFCELKAKFTLETLSEAFMCCLDLH